MTGRRSLQTFTERLSRQSQFAPGHVGGRVASAQPVRRRLTIGEATPRPPLAEVPLWWRVQILDEIYRRELSTPNWQTMDISGCAIATDVTQGSAVTAFCVGIDTGWTAPSGWTVLASGSQGLLDYLICYLVTTDLGYGEPGYPGTQTDSWVWGIPNAPTDYDGTQGTGAAAIYLNAWDPPVNSTPAAVVASGTGTSLALRSFGSMAGAGHYVASCAVGVEDHTQTRPAYASPYGWYHGPTYLGSPRPLRHAVTDYDFTDPGTQLVGSVDTSVSCDIVTVAIGWV